MASSIATVVLYTIAIGLFLCGVLIVKHAYDSSIERSIFPWKLDNSSQEIARFGMVSLILGVIIALATYFA